MRRQFSAQLRQLNTAMIRMGALCEGALAIVGEALAYPDGEIAKKVLPLEREIDHMERGIEGLCLKLILQQQPVAGDLRQISVALKMITDMERIGDQCADIAEIVMELNGDRVMRRERFYDMAREAGTMVTESIEAFVHRDLHRAKKVIEQDQKVDDCFAEIKKELARQLCRGDEGESVMDLLMIAKYLERIGDHAVNVAEGVIYMITGEPKGEGMP